jgi:anti-anti-sigma regulatory factor
MTNLFKTAKKEAPKSTKPQKVEVVVKDTQLAKDIARLAKINAEIDSLSAESNDLSSSIKTKSQEEFVKLYKETGKYPGSFNMVAGTSSVMVVPTDRYIKIDEERHNELQETYGEEIVEQKNTYLMDTEMVEKYGEVISELIMKSKKIVEEDKAKLIYVTTSYTVKKGTISSLIEKFKKFSMTTIIEDIRPVFQLKNAKA